ncbi:camphor resistance protein CrcB [Hasllibacter halocynthiae]|uniref:Fluoride-specific ion channel FluC n=1 Tax=Hasllibacter halocynthiae TaxID=595589 RepID=A0A2T0X3I9_9RHOB|nr:fluoride efflux transporter CrcB [Hasllibacter halocynthiae]PRY93509.1 camphor resistance protein CrcB [Hasllibacter halocynthiae]
MLSTLIHVALGGALGASARWGLGLWVSRHVTGALPLAVLVANVVGSALMGAFVVWAARTGHTEWLPFVAVGFLGGFTTFSTFSLEAVTLLERGEVGVAAIYVALSVGLSIGGLALGALAARAAL